MTPIYYGDLFERLLDIGRKINPEEYPETMATIDKYDIEMGENIESPFDVAIELDYADRTKIMPKEVADLVIEIYLEEINQGNTAAMTNLGSIYYTGRCGEQSYEKALKYYEMADKAGERQATENLGYCYYYGRVGEPDYEKAYHYFVKGALDGHLNALYKVGDMYRYGYYVEKDENEAFYIYSHCYRNLNDDYIQLIGADICRRMGDAFFLGIGVEKHYELALRFYQEAEQNFYIKINNGDFFARKGLEYVIERQAQVRNIILSSLPDFEWTEKEKCETERTPADYDRLDGVTGIKVIKKPDINS